ncbi:undecaprenyldiphospho-muramoylpentapeptide beta-N-acetylglucosaminyltransferase [Hydrogenoanaerobacterium sp.]|uniref:undecaprenyldiphospho-muramoylpentapeptide beta-N-acetylglucosaminyltransferase n=1 Tax=Hydrogenoanaerobacterium sp. TaxID=2953763 RepID=UPI00289EFF85|nr:undecaprenyldiphospho-muramoylpentapeptide beta-N-acetylglucosaminyltransferase [Hydrogenoanaerobacterium sp.]
MRILFACGGTAGHINPAIAVAQLIRQKRPEAAILFAGNPTGMEARLVREAGFDFAPIHVKGFQRQLNWYNIQNNIKAVLYLTTASSRAKKIIEDFKPDVVMGTGGYVSGPVVREAARLHYKTITHEQNAFPGVTTKLLSRHVDKILLAVPDAEQYLNPNCEYVVTGNPVRQDIIFAGREEARKKMGVGDRVCLLSFGGSNGARAINESIAQLMAWHCKTGEIYHIHATGKYGVDLLPELLARQGIKNYREYPNLDIREYISDMPVCLAAADLVISRAGAITLSELQAAGRASILIPSPNVAANHQYYNAMVLQSADAACVIEEKDLTGEVLIDTVKKMIADRDRLTQLGRNASKIAILDSNERIYNEIITLLKK